MLIANPLEGAFTIFSVVLILATIGYLVWEGLSPSVPPTFSAAMDKPPHHEAGLYYLPISVENSGTETARGVQITVALEREGETHDEGKATIDWLPGRSTRQAVVIFTKDPRLFRTRFKVDGYEVP